MRRATCRRYQFEKDSKHFKNLTTLGTWDISHPESIPLDISVKRLSWCRKKVYARTLEDFWYRDAVVCVEIPAGFTCDLASVPPLLWFLFDPFELAREGILHDQMYRTQVVPRAFADFLFRYLQARLGKPWWVRWATYLAVRLFAGRFWNQYTERLKRARRAEQSVSSEPD